MLKSMRRMTGKIWKLGRDRRGNVSMIFGLAVVPLVAAAGVGIDLSRGFMVKQRLAHALDAAALAVGRATDKSESELEAVAQAYFNANYPASELGVPGSLSMTVTDGMVSMSASAHVDTAIMNIVGYDQIDVSAVTEVTRKVTGLDVVFVLDNTGSMGSNGKLSALKTAATDLVDILFGGDETSEDLRVGLVPFAAAVNVGSQYANADWMDTKGKSSVHGLNFNYGKGNMNAFHMYDKLTNKSWNGCVEARPHPYDVQDTAPDASDADTLFVPYFAPDEPDIGYYYGYYYPNSYLYDNPKGNWSLEKRQANPGKYANKWVNSAGPHYNCATPAITPLTGTKQTVLDAIDDMIASGTTNIPFGLAWGWRVISPGAPFTQGAEYDDEKFRKVVILLTDGENYIGSYNNHNKSQYNAYGYVKDGRLGTTYSANSALDELNDRTAEVCENIKNASTDPERPIMVYTITFQLYDHDIKTLMRNCASDPEKYFDSPSNSQLKANFKLIAGELSQLRISK